MSNRTISRILATLLSIALCVPALGWADPGKANQFYEEAAVEYEKGNYDAAAELLYKAYAEDTNLIYVYNRILALQAAGRLDEALRELKVYENRMQNDSAKRFEDIMEIKAGLEKRIEARDAEVKDPEVKDPDVEDPGDKDPKDGIEDPNPVETGSNGPGVVGWSLMGGGAVLVGVGALFASGILLSLEAERGPASNPGQFVKDISAAIESGNQAAFNTALDEAYPNESSQSAQIDNYDSDKSSIQTNEILTITLIGVGTAAIIGGVVYWLASGGESAGGDVPASAKVSPIEVLPYANTDGAGASFKLTF